MAQVQQSAPLAANETPAQHLIEVTPTSGGWTVTADAVEVMVFRRGGQAEQSARHLGAAMAQAGSDAEVRIHLKDGSLGGRWVCRPLR